MHHSLCVHVRVHVCVCDGVKGDRAKEEHGPYVASMGTFGYTLKSILLLGLLG